MSKDHATYGDTYPHIRAHLDKAAKRLKVTSPLDFEFEDPRIYAELFGDRIPEGPAERIKTQKLWHSTAMGHKTFAALLKSYLSGPGKWPPPTITPEAVRYELEAFTMILAYAAKKRDSFRIETFA